jgi:hypothetical protein
LDAADAYVKGALTVAALYLLFWACRTAWRLFKRSARALRRSADGVPQALEATARAAGQASSRASALGQRLKQAYGEGRRR